MKRWSLASWTKAASSCEPVQRTAGGWCRRCPDWPSLTASPRRSTSRCRTETGDASGARACQAPRNHDTMTAMSKGDAAAHVHHAIDYIEITVTNVAEAKRFYRSEERRV